MHLAADSIVIEIAGEAYVLRPLLLAATRLARRYGDFAAIYKAILADHVTVTADVIREGSGSTGAADDFLTAASFPGLRSTLAPLKRPLLRYVSQLAGHDDAETETKSKPGKPVPFAEYHETLFRIGTGWLGWSPADTWAATPAEIIAAQRGRTDMISDVLKAVFGTAADEPDAHTVYTPEKIAEIISTGHDPVFDRAGLHALKQKGKR